MTTATIPKRAQWKFLRIKQDSVDDPDWLALNVDPDTYGTVVIGGTASDGDYIIHFDGTDAQGELVDVDITFTREAAEANAAIASGLDTLLDAAIAAELEGILASSTLNSLTLTLVLEPGVNVRISTSETTATGTITVTAGGDGKVCRQLPGALTQGDGDRRRVECRIYAVDADGDIVSRGTTASPTITTDVAGVDVVKDKTRASSLIADDTIGFADDAVLLADSAIESAVPLQRPFFLDISGSEAFTVRITGISDFTSVDRLVVIYREAC